MTKNEGKNSIHINFLFIDNKIEPKEDSTCECKQSFSMANKYLYAKIMASFANNKGGSIIFGVKNENYDVVGLKSDKFRKLDPVKLTEVLNAAFDPEMIWEKEEMNVNDKQIGIIRVEEAKNKPIICKKNTNKLKEGDIYYRYPGQTRKIKYSELSTILNKEKEKLVKELFAKIKKIRDIGIEDSTVLNKKIIIETVPLSEIPPDEKGTDVHEKVQQPRIVLGTIIKHSLGVNEIVEYFLTKNIPRNVDPKECLIQIGKERSQRYPVFYYIKEAKVTIKEAEEYIKKNLPGDFFRKRLLERLYNKEKFLKGYTMTYHSKTAQKRKRFYESILNKTFKKSDLQSDDDFKRFLEALTNLNTDEINKYSETLFPILLSIFKKYFTSEFAGIIRDILCKFDNLLYG